MQLSLDYKATNDRPIRTSDYPIDHGFPVDSADRLAKAESYNKHLFRPNKYVHKWWARRCGSTFRYIMKSLVDDPDKADYYAPGGLEGRLILDPMMGGGTTIHEALRMGANCIGLDIDPIPVVQVAASLSLRDDKSSTSTVEHFLLDLRERLGDLFSTRCPDCEEISDFKYVLYALLKSCSCGPAAFVDSLVLRQHRTNPTVICGSCHSVTSDNSVCICDQQKTLNNIVIRPKQDKVCEKCKTRYREDTTTCFRDRYMPIAVFGRCESHGEFIKSPDSFDEEKAKESSSGIPSRLLELDGEFIVSPGPKSKDLIKRGITRYTDLFTARQLIYIEHSIQLLNSPQYCDNEWLGLILSTSLEFNSILCGYKGASIKRPGAVRHVFSHHAYSFPHTALENNPVNMTPASGNLQRLVRDRVIKGDKWASLPIERRFTDDGPDLVPIEGETDTGNLATEISDLIGTKQVFLKQHDITMGGPWEGQVDFVITDPPYFDSVQYTDLSTFFRVWLKQLLPRAANWTVSSTDTAVFNKNVDIDSYGTMLESIWTNCYRSLKNETGRLIFTYHHWDAEAWTQLTWSLLQSNFRLSNRFTIFSENPISVHIRDLNALKHDCILVLEPIMTGSSSGKTVWPSIQHIRNISSEAFTDDCGTFLGWALETVKKTDGIDHMRQLWIDAMGGSNGKEGK
jgi:putative DNA methylase